MKKRQCAACVLLLVCITSTDMALACGDKFLVPSRGTRYQQAPMKRDPHTILIWANPSAELPQALAGVSIDETLRKVGYKPTIVATAAEFDNAMGRGGWDLVIVGVADAFSVRNRFHAPILLPVATDSQLKKAKQEYKVVLKAGAKSAALVSAVDEAFAQPKKIASKTGD